MTNAMDALWDQFQEQRKHLEDLAVTKAMVALGINLDAQAYDGLSLQIQALVTGLYYAGLKALEEKYPWVGWLLGLAKQPVYVEPAAKPTVENVAEIADAIVTADAEADKQ